MLTRMPTFPQAPRFGKAGPHVEECGDVVWITIAESPSFSDQSKRVMLSPEHLPGACLVKRGDKREVWRATVENCDVHIKASWKQQKSLFDEGVALREAAHRNVPVISAIAGGYATRDKQLPAILVTRTPNDFIPLDRWWESYARRTGIDQCSRNLQVPCAHSSQSRGPGERNVAQSALTCRRVMRELALTVARAHAAGFHYPDGHPGNYLLCRDYLQEAGKTSDAAPWECRLVDVAGAAFTRDHAALSRPYRIRSLAQLDKYFYRKLSEPRRLVFLRQYLRAFAGLTKTTRDSAEANDGRKWANWITDSRGRLAAKLARHWDRRLRKSGKYFQRLSFLPNVPGGRNWSGQFVLNVERRHQFGDIIDDMTARQWQEWVEHLLSDRAGETREIAANSLPTVPEREFEVERFEASSLFDALMWTIRGSVARRRFLQAHRERHRDRFAPLLLGWLEGRSSGLIRECMLFVPSQDSGTGRISRQDQGGDT